MTNALGVQKTRMFKNIKKYLCDFFALFAFFAAISFLTFHLVADKLIYLRRVGFASGHFHHLSDKESHHLVFAAFQFFEL